MAEVNAITAQFPPVARPPRPLFEQALTDLVRVLGQDHLWTKIMSGNLAAARQQPH